VTGAALLALALSAQPSPMRLGRDASAVLRVVTQSAAEPALSVSVGRVEAPRHTGEGTWEAQYVPPDDGIPQVAIVMAVAAGEVAWIALPLWAEGDAVVKTRPRGRITVEIGSQTFGPVTADPRGEAIVPVVVPPGVTQARQGKRMIPLGVPPSRMVHVAFGETGGAADRAQTVAVYAIATTADGAPRRGAAIRLRSSRGALSALHEVAPGLYQSRLSLDAGAPGEVQVTAALDDAPAFVAKAALSLSSGPADRIAIAADRERIRADEPAARLHVSARDAAGNPAADPVEFETSAGELRATATAAGEWDLALSLPASFGGRKTVQVRALAANASAAHAFALEAGPLETIAFEDPDAVVIADGESPLRMQVELRDRHGNPISGVRPQLSAENGRAELEERGDALYASYIPPLLQERQATVLAASVGTAVGRANLLLLPNLPSTALSARLGLLSDLSGFSTPLLGVEAQLRTIRLGPVLALSLEADYGYRSHSEILRAGATNLMARSRIDLLQLHLSAAWRRRFGDRNTLWLAAGPSAAMYWTRLSTEGSPSRRSFAIAPGLQAALGVERRMRLAVPFLELRAGWITGPGSPVLVGPLRSLSFFGGVRIETP
jgi:hypothetical protein